MLNQNNINTPKETAFLPYGMFDKPVSVGVLLLNNMDEIWKDIPGYEGYYQASTLGRIKSLPKLTGIQNKYSN
jgi:hypothetical protein